MIKRALLAFGFLVVILGATGTVMYLRNDPPIARSITPAEAATSSKPFVVKLHAKWCPICMMTKDVWSAIDTAYRGRVNLVVFDFTDQGTTEQSRVLAQRLGLGKFFEENSGWTGTIAVLDPHTKEATATIHGSRDFAEYQAAIDARLR